MNIDLDNFTAAPSIAVLSHGAFRLHVGALDYCDRHDTGTGPSAMGTGRNGTVPLVLVPTLMPRYRSSYTQELVDADLWTVRGDTAGDRWVEVRES